MTTIAEQIEAAEHELQKAVAAEYTAKNSQDAIKETLACLREQEQSEATWPCRFGDVCEVEYKTRGHTFYFDTHYKNREAAERALARQQVQVELQRLSEKAWRDAGYAIQWGNDYQDTWSLIYNYNRKQWGASDYTSSRLLGVTYFPTKAFALAALETIGHERMALMLEA